MTHEAPAEQALDDQDGRYLRRAIELSALGSAKGNRPFGAVIVHRDGQLLAEAWNDNASTGDCTGHAELNALRIASPAHGRAGLEGATMYASSEPCVMCAGAIFWSNIRRVVFGIDATSLRPFRQAQAGAADLEMSCREVFRHSPHPIEVLGPSLRDEAAAVHRAYWVAR